MASADIDSLFADAYAFIEQGLCYDEVDDRDNACLMYERGLELGDKALQLDTERRSGLRNGLERVRGMVADRIDTIRSKAPHVDSRQAVENIRHSLVTASDDTAGSTTDAELFYWLPDGVQLVVIEGDQTNAPTPPSSLAIFKLTKPEEAQKTEKASGATTEAKDAATLPLASSSPAAFIQVGPWAYPLEPGKTAILKNELGVYVMPNPTPDHPNMFVGIILPRELAPGLESEFVYALKQFAVLNSSDIVDRMSEEQRERTSERIAQFLIRTGQYIAFNTQNAAQWTGEYVAKKGEQYRAGMEPGAEQVNISPAIRHGVFVLHKSGKLIGKVTRFLLDKIGDVGIAIGQRVADSLGGESGGGRVFKSTVTVLGGGITAVSTVWIALEDATKTLMRNMANETVQTVQLRYGDEASQTAHHTLYALGHTTLAGFQLYELGPRSIAGRMARKAGLQLVHGVGGVQQLPQQRVERVVWRAETYSASSINREDKA
ncbi:hypothetical protein niasHS_001328 [Heterodera schachtii]|uniref:Senescence domain-containing protein n=1 Tax=Heterodera schachtii TaxID=97005 RepID=A0ABD2KLA6_HETSC